ncbi:MAG: hypothetical protein JWO30_713 [Fibrobacteres bacterium]|nr:hypothetical protein [Fibrobacterota bacterium]
MGYIGSDAYDHYISRIGPRPCEPGSAKGFACFHWTILRFILKTPANTLIYGNTPFWEYQPGFGKVGAFATFEGRYGGD